MLFDETTDFQRNRNGAVKNQSPPALFLHSPYKNSYLPLLLNMLIKKAAGYIMEIYVVRQNDTVDTIAHEQGADVNSIIEINQLAPPYRLALGQALLFPGNGSGQAETICPSSPRPVFKSGYAYPFISPPVLNESLGSLSELAVFSYGFTPSGDLIPPTLDDTWMVMEALHMGITPALTLTPLGADGRFNNNLVSVLVNQESIQRRLVNSLAAVMLEKGYQAVNIDFEYVLKEDRDAFTTFVAYATNVLNTLGYQVSVALAPKHSDDQKGLLYEGMDYGGLGAAANWVILMTYEWGYTYNPTGLWYYSEFFMYKVGKAN